jgi:CheY-like chemotaxis protein
MITSTDKEIQILFLEDVPLDAELVSSALQHDGLKFRFQRVDTREGFLFELRQHPPDVILSDHGLPQFSGFSALALAREHCPSTPFIFVTDAHTPDVEIEKLAPDVTDVIPKRDLSKLAPVIRRALAEPRRRLTREQRRQTVQKLLELVAAYELDGAYIPICSWCKNIRDTDGHWLLPEVYFSRHLELKFTHGICTDCWPNFARQK